MGQFRKPVPTAVVVLAVAVETALKWHLAHKGDAIARFLIENIQSPPLHKLASCARENAGLPIPDRHRKWLQALAEARNRVVHRPDAQHLKPLEIARWFAVGEALLKQLQGIESDPLVGAYVEVSSKIVAFPKGTRGIVLRRETAHGEDSLHVFLDSGATRRFNDAAITALGDKPIE